jgi:adenylate kinase
MIIILGPPGSGKGTQIRNLNKLTNRPYFSAGDNLKVYGNSHPHIKELLEKGINIDTDDVNEYLTKTGLAFGLDVIFDGFPRTEKQLNYFLQYISNNFSIKNIIEGVFILNVAEEKIINRIINRYICNKCHITYNSEEICCGNKKTNKRLDDINLDVIKRRINNYNNNIDIMVKIYKNYNIPIYYINGENTIHEVTNEILKYLK